MNPCHSALENRLISGPFRACLVVQHSQLDNYTLTLCRSGKFWVVKDCLGSFRYMGPFGFFQGRFGLGPRVVWVYFELTTDGILTMTLNEPTTLKNPLPKTPRACDPLLSRMDLGPKSDLGPKLCSRS